MSKTSPGYSTADYMLEPLVVYVNGENLFQYLHTFNPPLNRIDFFFV